MRQRFERRHAQLFGESVDFGVVEELFTGLVDFAAAAVFTRCGIVLQGRVIARVLVLEEATECDDGLVREMDSALEIIKNAAVSTRPRPLTQSQGELTLPVSLNFSIASASRGDSVRRF